MGQGSSAPAIGQKIREGFDVIGKGISNGWEQTKNFGKKVWEGVKSVPILGSIATGLEKAGDYVGLGNVASSITKAIDTGIGAVGDVFRGDIGGALNRGASGFRDLTNQRIPLLEDVKKVPVLGDIVRKAEDVPIYGGMSLNAIRGLGSAAASGVSALTRGDIGGVLEAAKQGAIARGGNTGKAVSTIDRTQKILSMSKLV